MEGCASLTATSCTGQASVVTLLLLSCSRLQSVAWFISPVTSTHPPLPAKPCHPVEPCTAVLVCVMHGSQWNCGDCWTTTDCRPLRGPDEHQHSIRHCQAPHRKSVQAPHWWRCSKQMLHAAAPLAVTRWVPCHATHHLGQGTSSDTRMARQHTPLAATAWLAG